MNFNSGKKKKKKPEYICWNPPALGKIPTNQTPKGLGLNVGEGVRRKGGNQNTRKRLI